MLLKADFEKMFNPKSVAFIGASSNSSGGGGDFLAGYKEGGFPGRLYPVNPKADVIHGLKAYPNIGSLPETPDLVVVTVPRRLVPQILTECADAGAKNIHIFTAGFRESGEEEGLELEKRIIEIAQERGLAIIGPNGMGPTVPKSRIGSFRGGARESGTVAVIAQSGTIAGNCTSLGLGLGVRFSKIVSFGNGIILDSTDYLEYLADDPDTKIIAMYLEGVMDGRKLTNLVKEINPHKPIAIMKGGLTESGARAAESHTGSMAGSESVWNAFFKQTGAIRVDTPEELMDMTAAFVHMHPLRGKRLALVGAGGGLSVSSADACAREGLTVPPFSEETRLQLREYVPSSGTSIRNPLDSALVFGNTRTLEKTINMVAADPTNDGILIYSTMDFGSFGDSLDRSTTEEKFELISDFAKNNPYRKPVAAVLRSMGHDVKAEAERMNQQKALAESGVAVFPTFARAALALRRFADYHEFLRTLD